MKLSEVVDEMYALLQKRAEAGDIEAYSLICRIEGKEPAGIKPCPFCGGRAEPYQEEDESWVRIKCTECWAETNGCDTLETALEQWNNRAYMRLEGKWVQEDRDTGDKTRWKCSVCHNVVYTKYGTPLNIDMNYCQYCGSHMSIDKENGHD
ncbi:MAG: Lar family restriction alleviation protein [Synergistaceae bacterium]|nr:Lar family restriction alleviation protein [Synergistaceae bacterium]